MSDSLNIQGRSGLTACCVVAFLLLAVYVGVYFCLVKRELGTVALSPGMNQIP
jgi:hypothetical protein